MKRSLLSFIFFSFVIHSFVCSAQNKQVITPKVKARIDSTLKSFIDNGQVAGISSLIYEKGKEVYYKAYGYADIEANKPMSRNTIVRIYSMTKPIVGVALMNLYDKGAFKMDDPIEKYAPEFANMQVYAGYDSVNKKFKLVPANRPPTIRDLTRYTAGFDGQMPGVPRGENPTDSKNTL